LLAKISAWGLDRRAAIDRLHAALRETVVLGPTTNLAFLQDVLAHPAFRAGETHTGFLDDHLPGWRPEEGEVSAAAIAAALGLRSSTGGAPTSTGPARAPSPWETLGRWRLGT
jgi:acetyl/propionyl-CoA carboxylase alpha subunit